MAWRKNDPSLGNDPTYLEPRITKAEKDINDLQGEVHTHPNKTVLDKFNEDTNGKPTYNGQPVGAVTSVNGETGEITITPPTKTSELTNDSDFVTLSDVSKHTETIASATELGHVKVDGVSVAINEEGVLYIPLPPVDDDSGSPGSNMLLAGDMQAGYFGRVPASEFITPTQLSTEVGISAGTFQAGSPDWLKFAFEGRILFRPVKAFKNTISWNDINAAGCVYGTTTVTINGLTYRVRLMKGSITNPTGTGADLGTKGSEWNRLILPITDSAITGEWSHPTFVDDNTPNWNIGLTDSDLGTSSSGSGSQIWCQEDDSANASNALMRGYGSYARAFTMAKSSKTSLQGWCPVLELI